MDIKDSGLRKEGAINGIWLGLIILALGILLYYYVTRLTDSLFIIVIVSNMVVMLLELFTTAFFCYKLRKQIGGFWTLRQATTAIFMMFIVAYAIQGIGKEVIFPKFVDHNTAVNIRDAMKKANMKTLKEGADPKLVKQRDNNIEMEYNNALKNIDTGQFLQGLVITVILIFVASLIFAALFKREPPLRVVQTE